MWVIGIVAGWLIVGGVVAYWAARTISRADLEESAAELRREEIHETPPAADDD
ncbi:MAG: hypothetical protein ACOH2Q_18860 [Rhodococcus sp. (in: high G+C Gram-positive bacteria)]